jgi:hypothetical protein
MKSSMFLSLLSLKWARIVKLVAAARALVVLLQALYLVQKVGKFNELRLQVKKKWSMYITS